MHINNMLATIQSNFIARLQAYNTSREALEAKIAARRKQVARLENRLLQTHCPRWTAELLRPVLDEVKKQLPDWHCDDEKLIPLGLGCRVSVFFIKKGLPPAADPWSGDNSIYITFLPGTLDNGELRYETGERTGNFQPGTIGEINGFNNVTKPLESIGEAVTFLQAQMK